MLVASKPALTADQSDARADEAQAVPAPRALVDDIRAKPYGVRTPLRSVVRRLASIVALISIDICGLALGLYLALLVRQLIYRESSSLWSLPWKGLETYLPFLVLLTLLVFWQARLYAERERRAGVGRIISSLALVTVLTVAFAWGVGHDFGTYGLAPTAFLFSAALIALLRWSYDSITRDVFKIAGVRRRAVVVGRGENLAHLHRTLGSARGGIEYDFVGAVAPDDESVGLPVLGWLESVPELLAGRHVDELIVNGSDLEERELLELVEQAHREGVQVRVAPSTVELLTQRGEYIPGQGVPLFELRPPAFAGTDWVLKRAFDIVVSAGVVLVGLPLWLAIGLAIKLTSPGPIFYRDPRIGLGERQFDMLKFRTMRAGAREQQEALEGANEASGALFKIRDDPRVTPVGRFLRRVSLDEVPQVWNVLRGEMSLVGPRPLPLRDFQQLEPWHRKRHLVLPGMTGLWQISGRASLTFDDLVRLDFYYLENWSIWLDITILLKTIPAVFAREGAY